MRAWVVVAAMGLLSANACASSVKVGRDTEVRHRSGVGTIDSTGWTDASSTGGAFSAKLPCKFDDYTLIVGDPSITTKRAFMLRCIRADGSIFVAGRGEYVGGMATAQKEFAVSSQNGMWPGALNTREPYQGHPAIKSVLIGNGKCEWGRVTRADANNILMFVRGAGAACEGLEADAAVFLNSLKVQAG